MSTSQQPIFYQSRSNETHEAIVTTGMDSPALRFYAFASDQVLNALEPLRGKKLLDIAAGTGHMAISAIQSVKPDGRVHVVEQDAAHLDILFEKQQQLGIEGIDIHEMDLTSLDFRSAYFDVAICIYGVGQLPEPQAAINDWVRVLKPGGKLVLACFAETAFQPLLEKLFIQLETAAETLQPPAKAQLTAQLAKHRQDLQLFSDSNTIQTWLQQAGLDDVAVHSRPLGYHLTQVQDWWEIIAASPWQALIDGLPASVQSNLIARHSEEISALGQSSDDGESFWLDASTHFIGGTKN
ncbi:class I SAM-dependent methyltransferase [Candidatus Venteria ishoeyi]|uniref:Ubiquinone/menaquinone biosynthesis C-methyltransferase UbiE n=1 Tax=Candidatus Venteria ishoeyi TaxID=1899563 RepID=A0A1H6FHH4_9GAMM|nr:class I SAM-dependent methyltransferase [Candidatus Venteria ishoeyi]SEH08596.1 Ubiquinone/menaquinone biosynthesis C-methyltransferase UbiE [Candidatus Venteria ishoeyi]